MRLANGLILLLGISCVSAAVEPRSPIVTSAQILEAPETLAKPLLAAMTDILKLADFRDFPPDIPSRMRNELRLHGVSLNSFHGSVRDAFVWSYALQTVGSYCGSRRANPQCQSIPPLIKQIQNLRDLSEFKPGERNKNSFRWRWPSLLPAAEAAAAKCGYSEKEGVFTTKSGDRIEFIFDRHAHPFALEEILAKFSDKKATNEDKMSSVDKFLKLHQELEQSLKGRREKLVAAQKHGAKWMGIEAPAEMVTTESQQELRESMAALRNSMKKSGIPDEKIDRSVAIVCAEVGGNCDEKNLPPAGLELAGIDDGAANDRGYALMRKNKEILMVTDFSKFSNQTIPRLKELQTIASQAKTISMTDMNSVLSQVGDETTKENLRQYIVNLQAFSKEQNNRNVFAADSIRGLSSSGIVLFGEHHKEGILRALEASCAAKTSKTPSTSR